MTRGRHWQAVSYATHKTLDRRLRYYCDWAQARIADITLTPTETTKAVNLKPTPLPGTDLELRTSLEKIAQELITHAKTEGVTLRWVEPFRIEVVD